MFFHYLVVRNLFGSQSIRSSTVLTAKAWFIYASQCARKVLLIDPRAPKSGSHQVKGPAANCGCVAKPKKKGP